MRDPYATLAPTYDAMAREPGISVFYGQWRKALLDAARERDVSGNVLVDIACGTGNSTIPWTRRRGWTVIGVDRSASMLKVARRKSRAVRWLRQDLVTLQLDVAADFVTCHFDALNHLVGPHDLDRCLERVGRTLRPGGLFLFDLNTVHWLRWLAGREKLFHPGSDYFTAYSAYDEKTGIATFNQMWFVKRGRLFDRRLVTVRERAFTEREIKAALARGGLRLLRVDDQVRMEGKPFRRLYLAQRMSGRRASATRVKRQPS